MRCSIIGSIHCVLALSVRKCDAMQSESLSAEHYLNAKWGEAIGAGNFFENGNNNKMTNLDPRIVGGTPVDPPDSYPFFALLHKNGFYFCGGALISPTLVLSAAHCATEYADSVMIGRSDINDPLDEYENIDIVDVFIHPAYNENNLDNDFALFKLAEASTYQPIELDDGFVELDGTSTTRTPLTVMGFGLLYFDGPQSDTLLEAQVEYLTQADCQQAYKNFAGITSNMLCASAPGNDACQGDSGGPLITADGTNVLVGVVSWGQGCADPDFPGVYARVSSQYSWIETYLVDGSSSGGDRSLTCPFAGNVMQSGNMFDVVAWKMLTLKNFALNIGSNYVEAVEVYWKNDTHVDFESDSGAWDLIGDVDVQALGPWTPSYIPVGDYAMSPVEFFSGDKKAFYITLRDTKNIIYSTSSGTVGSVYVENADMTVYTGSGVIYPFGVYYRPRLFNGIIEYYVDLPPTIQPTIAPSLKMTFAAPFIAPITTSRPSENLTNVPSASSLVKKSVLVELSMESIPCGVDLFTTQIEIIEQETEKFLSSELTGATLEGVSVVESVPAPCFVSSSAELYYTLRISAFLQPSFGLENLSTVAFDEEGDMYTAMIRSSEDDYFKDVQTVRVILPSPVSPSTKQPSPPPFSSVPVSMASDINGDQFHWLLTIGTSLLIFISAYLIEIF